MTEKLEYPFGDDIPAPVQRLAVAPGVEWVRMKLPFALDHINLWLLDDGEGVAIVDTGYGDAGSRAQWEQIFEQLGRPVTRVIVTHAHPDHVGNAQWLSVRFGVPVFMTLGEYFWAHSVREERAGFGTDIMVAFFRRHGMGDEHAAALTGRGNHYASGVPQLPTQYVRILDGEALRIGAHDWQVIEGFGHSAEHAALWCEALGLLISGDMLLPRISTNVSTFAMTPADDPVGRYTRSLERFAALPADVLVLPSHGRPFRGARLRIEALCAHHEARCSELLAALVRPMSAAELLDTLFPRKLDTHQLMFAMGEAIAHLNHLAARGAVACVSAADGIQRFERNAAA